jgi:hypothetical protein
MEEPKKQTRGGDRGGRRPKKDGEKKTFRLDPESLLILDRLTNESKTDFVNDAIRQHISNSRINVGRFNLQRVSDVVIMKHESGEGFEMKTEKFESYISKVYDAIFDNRELIVQMNNP